MRLAFFLGNSKGLIRGWPKQMREECHLSKTGERKARSIRLEIKLLIDGELGNC